MKELFAAFNADFFRALTTLGRSYWRDEVPREEYLPLWMGCVPRYFQGYPRTLERILSNPVDHDRTATRHSGQIDGRAALSQSLIVGS
jgi:hypothetical protein